jgi:hypothetical protein
MSSKLSATDESNAIERRLLTDAPRIAGITAAAGAAAAATAAAVAGRASGAGYQHAVRTSCGRHTRTTHIGNAQRGQLDVDVLHIKTGAEIVHRTARAGVLSGH